MDSSALSVRLKYWKLIRLEAITNILSDVSTCAGGVLTHNCRNCFLF